MAREGVLDLAASGGLIPHSIRGDDARTLRRSRGIRVEELLHRARRARVLGLGVQVISPEDLVLLKRRAGRERDLSDAAAILVKMDDELGWEYLAGASDKLKIDLKGFLMRSLERIPVTVDNPPKVRKRLRKLIEGVL